MTPLITFTPMFVAWRRHMMDFLLTGDRGLPVRFERADLLTWCGGPMADHLCDILDRVPAHAWRPA